MAIKTEEGISYLISVMGLNRCDFVYYLARILNAASKRVLVVDNSARHEMFECIPKVEGAELGQTGDIYYMCQKAYSEAFFSQFDFVIVFHGLHINAELNEKSDYRFLETDYLANTTKDINKQLERQNTNLTYYVIFRDKVFNKITERMILEELGMQEKNINEQFEISYNEQDYMCYLGLLRNGAAQIKSTSTDMRSVLTIILKTIIPDKTPKEYKQIFKKVLAGKII